MFLALGPKSFPGSLRYPQNDPPQFSPKRFDLSRLLNDYGVPWKIYAHIEIVVAFLVVNFFGFLVITRDHGSFERRH